MPLTPNSYRWTELVEHLLERLEDVLGSPPDLDRLNFLSDQVFALFQSATKRKKPEVAQSKTSTLEVQESYVMETIRTVWLLY